MSDFNSSLPIRSEADGLDARVQVKIVDKTNPTTQQMIVDTDSNAHVEMHGNKPDTTDVAIQLSEEGRPNSRGDYDGTTNTKPASNALIAHTRNAAKTEAHQAKRVSAIDSSVNNDVTALDVAIRDELGNPFSNTNPLPVAIAESEGTEIHDYLTSAAVAAAGSVNHNYSVPNGSTLYLHQVLASASGKMKIEIQIGDGDVVEVFAPKAARFNSTANPQADTNFSKAIAVVGTINNTTVRVIRTNLDNQAQDLYSTIIGILI